MSPMSRVAQPVSVQVPLARHRYAKSLLGARACALARSAFICGVALDAASSAGNRPLR